MKKVTEDQIVRHIAKHGKYHKRMKWPYSVSWGGTAFIASDTRELAVKVCKHAGIEVKP